jgi:hypothetical protein
MLCCQAGQTSARMTADAFCSPCLCDLVVYTVNATYPIKHTGYNQPCASLCLPYGNLCCCINLASYSKHVSTRQRVFLGTNPWLPVFVSRTMHVCGKHTRCTVLLQDCTMRSTRCAHPRAVESRDSVFALPFQLKRIFGCFVHRTLIRTLYTLTASWCLKGQVDGRYGS